MLLGNFWEWLRGPRDKFNLEERLINAVGLLSVCTLFIFVVYNMFVVVLPELALVTALTVVLQFVFFYASRFRRNFNVARFGFTFCSYIFLAVNYYYSSGIDGPVLFSFFVTLIIILVINEKQHYLYWLLHCGVVVSLLFYEYRYGVVNTYNSAAERSFDIACIFCIMLSLAFVLIKLVLKSYNRERFLANQRAEELAIVHQENTRLFSIISHDLRTPLNNIKGYLELLNSQLLTESDRSMLEVQLLELTNGTSDFLTNLLSWSKSQLDGTKVQLVNANLDQLLDAVLATINPLAIKKNLVIKKELKVNQFVADTEMTKMVLRNLLSNAVKYSKMGGEIMIKSEELNGRLILSVRDFGVGIATEKEISIFTSQVSSSLGTMEEPGVGLGLVLCADFVKLQKGKIWFNSEINQGTTFYLSFPTVIS
ncbi:sensor histidine kinase [Pedobacter xixiisoli]|uniref:histidine kinase n=1 Tax=Pedobacter xixiisoli TaxID=1476464 RepID=A0A285ZT36_9SPHI|nr:HAMP domain-containing sensor histidine kinase [Pedobacter xixiisoli]SOD12824.1 Signal transduction histidine kinase [Pedobacter xixiisoli]